ncbi:MAG: adenylate/guanylate cyclase domain-containing protein [Ahrensia sp.]|nr:adenylate/guanylate cyclase domain-containing protein [Ahrensia sp.]
MTFAASMIARSDAEAEALIGRVRMLVSTILCLTVVALLFQLPAETVELRRSELYAALAVTALYIDLGFASYCLARSAHYHPWHGFVFAMLEVALVLANIYFDIRDAQTNSLFALASPPVLMLALVLVLQVLRYRIVVHAAVSVGLISGVVLLLASDISLPVDPTARVLDELLLMYSPPPNGVRLIMLAVLATIVGLAIMRSRRLMETIAHELEESHNRNRFLPSELTSQMSDTDLQTLRRDSEREVVVMFVDMRNFTALSGDRSPADTAALLTTYRGLVMDAVLDHDGIVDKFIGDGVLCIFGLESSYEVAAQKAVLAGQGLMQSLAEENKRRAKQGVTPFHIAIALHGGSVFAAAIGDDRRLEFTVTGPEP